MTRNSIGNGLRGVNAAQTIDPLLSTCFFCQHVDITDFISFHRLYVLVLDLCRTCRVIALGREFNLQSKSTKLFGSIFGTHANNFVLEYGTEEEYLCFSLLNFLLSPGGSAWLSKIEIHERERRGEIARVLIFEKLSLSFVAFFLLNSLTTRQTQVFVPAKHEVEIQNQPNHSTKITNADRTAEGYDSTGLTSQEQEDEIAYDARFPHFHNRFGVRFSQIVPRILEMLQLKMCERINEKFERE